MKRKAHKLVYQFTNPVDYFIYWREKHPLISYKDMEDLTMVSKTFFYKVFKRKKDISQGTAEDFANVIGLTGLELQYFMMLCFTYRIIMNKKLRNAMLNKFRPYKYRRKK